MPKGLDSVHAPTICQLINLIVICAVYYQSILNWTGANINSILLLIFLKACFIINRLQTEGDYQSYIFTISIFSFNRYETSDGTYRREEGGLVPGPGGRSLVVRGEYGYIDSRGKPYSMKYVADANGYQPRINDDHTRFNDRRII